MSLNKRLRIARWITAISALCSLALLATLIHFRGMGIAAPEMLISLLVAAIVCAVGSGVILLVLSEQYPDESSGSHQRFSHLSKERNLVAVWEYDLSENKFICARCSRNRLEKFREIPDFGVFFVKSGTVYHKHIAEFSRFLTTLRTRMQYTHSELKMRDEGGEYEWYSIVGTRVDDSKGKPLRYFGQITNIHDNRSRSRVASDAAGTDALTGLYDRHQLAKKVDQALSQRSLSDSAMFLVDIDHFKRISENVGHLFGDALIIELAEATKRLFPDDCIAGRITRDELAVFVPDVTMIGSLDTKCMQLCRCVSHFSADDDQANQVTCSVGVTLCATRSERFEKLFYHADIALCSAKLGGRDTYRVYSDGMETQLGRANPASHEAANSADEASLENADHEDGDLLLQAGSLLAQVVEILTESRELSSSVNIILSLIGRRFGLDRCTVFMFSEDYMEAYVRNSWCADDVHSVFRSNLAYPMEEIERIIICGSDSRYFVSNDISEVATEHSVAYEIFQSNSTRALLQCPVLDGRRMCGCITYSHLIEGERFSLADIDEIVLISKIVGSYLVRQQTRRDIDRINSTDQLTGAMNLSRFIGEATRLVAENPSQRYAVVYSDFNNFKFVNETYGYSVGNHLLISFAGIVTAQLEPGELFARVNADKFIGLFKFVDQSTLDYRLDSCNQAINSVKRSSDSSFSLPIRSGIYCLQPEDNDISACLDNAILAMKSLKSIHISSLAYFDENMRQRIKKRMEIENTMRDALHNKEFIVVFQPKFSLDHKEVVGAEALVRWDRPGHGVLKPDDFIPIFEDNGFIIDVDFYVLDLVCQKIRGDIDSGRTVKPISVNFSRVHLTKMDFIDRLNQCIRKYSIPANFIEIEITESALTGNEDFLCEVMNSLHRIGIMVSMDDFGSGYSSLNLLKKLPFDVLKIDKNFFADSGATERERCIIANVVNMAKSLNIRVLSEGVETGEQASFLEGINCDLAQGYYFAHPMDVKDFEELYQKPTDEAPKDSPENSHIDS